VVVVVVDVSGAFSSSLAHAAESPTKAMIAAAPAMAGMRLERRDVMFFLSFPRLAVEPLSMRPIATTLSDERTFLQVITRRANAPVCRPADALTVSVGGCLLILSNILSNTGCSG
jgi:hypothetical protein